MAFRWIWYSASIHVVGLYDLGIPVSGTFTGGFNPESVENITGSNIFVWEISAAFPPNENLQKGNKSGLIEYTDWAKGTLEGN